MEIITEFVQNQLLYPTLVGAVILAGILLFTYAIRPVQQPQFLSGLDHNDRNKLGAKKKKIKEKKSTTNGHVASGAGGVVKTEKSPVKELKKSPTSSELKNKEKKVDLLLPKEFKKTTAAAAAEVPFAKKATEVQKKLNKKVPIITKPVDFDEGDWETVPSKSEKKKKIETPRAAKKDKKLKVNVEKDEEKSQHHHQPEEEVEEEIIVSEEVAPNVEEEIADAVVEEKVKKPKKIKAKAPLKPPPPPPPPALKTQIIEEVKIDEEKPKVSIIIEEEKTVAPTTNQNHQETVPAAPVFDELGDTWTEAKPVKKSKKKARKDN